MRLARQGGSVIPFGCGASLRHGGEAPPGGSREAPTRLRRSSLVRASSVFVR